MKRTDKKVAALVVLGGGLVQEGGIWRSAHFNDGDRSGAWLRVIAAHCLYQDEAAHNPAVVIVASGGCGVFCARGAPTLASVIKEELVDLGVPANAVLTEEVSGTTHAQLKEYERMARRCGWRKAAIISNDYHLPRIQAMIEYLPGFVQLHQGLRNKSVRLVSAEKTAIARDPTAYAKLVRDAYQGEAMQMRKQREAQGVADIRAGRYAFDAAAVTLRNAESGDLHFLLALRNEPGVRRASFNPHPIALAEHEQWFRKNCESSDCVFFVADIDGESIGTIRFDAVNRTDAEVHVAVSPSVRGSGYGRFIIRTGTMKFLADRPHIQSVRAHIKPDNEASVRSFVSAGYRMSGTSLLTGHECITLLFKNSS